MFLKNQRIRKKKIISCLVVTIVPLLILEIVFLTMMQRKNFKTIMDSASAYADQLEDNYQNELDKLERIAWTLANFSPLQGYLSMEFENKGEAFAYYKENIHPMLSSCNNVYAGTRVRIYHDREQIPNFSFELNNGLNEFVRQKFPYDGFSGEKGFWLQSNIRYNTYESVFAYYLTVRENTWPHEISYIICVHVNEDFFYTQIANEPPDSRIVLVMDKEGNILSSNEKDIAGTVLSDFPVHNSQSLLQLEDGERVVVNGSQYLLLRRETDNLNIVYMIDCDSIHSAQRMLVITLAAMGGILMLLASALIVRITRNITQGIGNLKQKMLNIDRESIRALAAYDLNMNSKDEVMQLDIVFTSMMGQIDILMDRIQFQERKLKDEIITRQQAEIRALQHQIDPHYLFNTLEAIRMNLVIKGDRENAEIIKLFAESFRRYVDMRDEYVTLFEEVEFIRKYIYIQNYRLNNKIKFICLAEERFLRYRILKLLLQPLVENAVCHGIEQKIDGGTITLEISRVQNSLRILVEDDGVGMKNDELEKLQSIVYSEQLEKSVGLHNVYQRVKLIYGEQAKMIIESQEGTGTKILLILPIDVLEESICFKS